MSRINGSSLPAGAPQAKGETPMSLDRPPQQEAQGRNGKAQREHARINCLLDHPSRHTKVIRMLDTDHADAKAGCPSNGALHAHLHCDKANRILAVD